MDKMTVNWFKWYVILMIILFLGLMISVSVESYIELQTEKIAIENGYEQVETGSGKIMWVKKDV